MEKPIVKRQPWPLPTLNPPLEMQKFKLSEGMTTSPAYFGQAAPKPLKAADPKPVATSKFFVPPPTRPSRPARAGPGGLRFYKNNGVRRHDSKKRPQVTQHSNPWRALVGTTPLNGLLKSIF